MSVLNETELAIDTRVLLTNQLTNYFTFVLFDVLFPTDLLFYYFLSNFLGYVVDNEWREGQWVRERKLVSKSEIVKEKQQ